MHLSVIWQARLWMCLISSPIGWGAARQSVRGSVSSRGQLTPSAELKWTSYPVREWIRCVNRDSADMVLFMLHSTRSRHAMCGRRVCMHFFVPKAMLQTYFKPPYFSSTEVEIFTGFPLGYMRTVMFMRLAGWPNSGKKRGLTEAYKLAPPWFRRASKIIVTTFVLVSTPMFVLGIFLYLSFCLLHGHC